jgi:hypothetical protein
MGALPVSQHPQTAQLSRYEFFGDWDFLPLTNDMDRHYNHVVPGGGSQKQLNPVTKFT